MFSNISFLSRGVIFYLYCVQTSDVSFSSTLDAVGMIELECKGRPVRFSR